MSSIAERMANREVRGWEWKGGERVATAIIGKFVSAYPHIFLSYETGKEREIYPNRLGG